MARGPSCRDRLGGTLAGSDVATLVGAEPIEVGQWVAIVQVPERILRHFRAIRDAGLQNKSADVVFQLAGSEEYALGLRELLAEMTARCCKPRYDGAGINTRPTGLSTCTVNSNTGLLTGMHVDTFYSRELELRALSPNRICINLGAEDRYLLFVNLPLREMRRQLEQLGVRDARINDTGRGLAWAFFESFPSYPIVRLRIAPGEAYLAPTENVVHDGSTEDKRLIDITLTILGTFAPDTFRDGL